MKTSGSTQMDLEGKRLVNFCAVFGRRVHWTENMQHIEKAYRDKMVRKDFRDMRIYGNTTERINAKGCKKGYPVRFKVIGNGTYEGILEYLSWWYRNRGFG